MIPVVGYIVLTTTKRKRVFGSFCLVCEYDENFISDAMLALILRLLRNHKRVVRTGELYKSSNTRFKLGIFVYKCLVGFRQ